ncbi:MAG: M48 family metallopeptidase [Anaerolineae bacterium]|nr:M48 family metallopeptidase [Anaerolineae bacterium]
MAKRVIKKRESQPVRQVQDGPFTLTVEVLRDRRLTKSVRWTVSQHTIQVRAPERLPAAELDRMVEDIIARVLKSRASARRRNDDDLEARARRINRECFNGELKWHTIRWVDNMQRRLGSCTSGGATDGDIRISDRIKSWPDYVVDYIVAHELAHRKHPNHSPAFWEYLDRYPYTERARGFIDGVSFAQGDDPDDLL